MEVVPAFVLASSGARRVGSGGSIDVAVAFPGRVEDVAGYTPSMSGTVGADNPLAFDDIAELVDCMF